MAMASLLVSVALGASGDSTTLLFMDHTVIAKMDPRLSLEMNPPVKGDRILSPTEPWESWAVFAYNSVVPGDSTRPHRIYYDCIQGTGVPPGAATTGGGGISHRYICLATSEDGLVWTKPRLGLFTFNGSTANNIIMEDSGVSVFIDHKPGVLDSDRWKMVCSNSAYSSADGLAWKSLPFTKVAEDDTKPTAYYDPNLDKYVVFVRRDLSNPTRRIGRCVTDDIANWQKETGGEGCPVVFSPDAQDPANVDIYTNAYTPYPSIENPAVHLLFPSYYFHFGSAAPFGFGNDGILDIRLVVSRNGVAFNYTGATNPRAPFVPLGINRCGGDAHAPGVKGGWCSPTSGIEAHTSFDTSAMYMANGYLPSTLGDEVYFYASGQAPTHGGDGAGKLWANQTGIRVLRARKDGFVFVSAPYVFNTAPPALTTVKLTVPGTCPPPVTKKVNGSAVTGCGYEFPGDKCPAEEPAVPCKSDADCKAADTTGNPTCHGIGVTCRAGTCSTGAVGGDLCAIEAKAEIVTSQGVVLRVNHITSVVGYVAIQVEDAATGAAIPGFEFSGADRLKANSIDSVASWHSGQTASLSSLTGKEVAFNIALTDAKLFAVTLECF